VLGAILQAVPVQIADRAPVVLDMRLPGSLRVEGPSCKYSEAPAAPSIARTRPSSSTRPASTPWEATDFLTTLDAPNFSLFAISEAVLIPIDRETGQSVNLLAVPRAACIGFRASLAGYNSRWALGFGLWALADRSSVFGPRPWQC